MHAEISDYYYYYLILATKKLDNGEPKLHSVNQNINSPTAGGEGDLKRDGPAVNEHNTNNIPLLAALISKTG